MRKIRELLHLKFECELPSRKIARSLGISHYSAGEHLCHFAANDLACSDASINVKSPC